MRTRARIGFVVGIVLLSAVLAHAQVPIQWSSSLSASVRTSKQTLKPLLIYVPASGSRENDDLERAQNRTFRDRLSVALVDERFVPVRTPRSNYNLAILNQLGAPTEYGNYLAVVSPEGELVGLVNPGDATRPDRFAQRLTTLFRQYRVALFNSQLKPVIEDDEASLANIRTALRVIRELLIEEASGAVVALLERKDLPDALRRDVYETLRVLSTPVAAAALFDAALDDPAAAEALSRCTPLAAEWLLTKFDLDKPEELRIAYEAVTAICRVSEPRSRAFFENADRLRIREEVIRVEKIARDTARRWWLRYGDLR